MTELDQVWSQMLEKAAANAHHSGQGDVAEYLRLKAANDTIRSIGVGWLIDTTLEIAGQAVRHNASIIIEREEPYNFAHGSSNIVGSLLCVRYGVRCLTLETGWTRTPSDGIMKNGALAIARVSHFGLPASGAEFRLVRGENLPHWLDQAEVMIESRTLERHVDLLLADT